MTKIKPPSNAMEVRQWLIDHKDLSIDALAKLSRLSKRTIIKWCILYDVIDHKNITLLKAWVQYKEYTNAEMAIILGMTERALKYYLYRHLIENKSTKGLITRYIRYATDDIKFDRSILFDKDRLAEIYKNNGRVRIARGCGVSKTRVMKVLKKFGIISSRSKYTGPENKYRNKEWLIENYINKNMTQKQCAKIAGVSQPTIRNWLTSFGIKPRDTYEAHRLKSDLGKQHVSYRKCGQESQEISTAAS